MAKEKPIAMKIQMGDKVKEVSFEELTLSNNLAQQALVRLLIKKNIFTAEEFYSAMEEIRKAHYRDPEGKTKQNE